MQCVAIKRSSLGSRSPRFAALLASCGLACGLAASAAGQLAEFVPIPGQSTVPGTTGEFCGLSGTTGYSGVRVSADGRVVSTIVYGPGDWNGAVPTRAARWTAEAGTVVISPVLQGLYPTTGISSDGSTIYGESWRWTSSGGYEDLRDRLSHGLAPSRLIFGCSDDGQTVTGTAGYYPSQADLYTWRINEGDPQILPRDAAFPTGYFYFNTISGDGQTVAGSARRIPEDPFTNPDALAGVIVTPSGTNVITGESGQDAVNDLSFDGSVAVGATTVGFELRAFRWTQNTGVAAIDAGLVGAGGSYARAVDATGSTIVGDYLIFGEAGTKAYIWREGQGAVDLYEDLVGNYGLGAALSGWQLLVATDVSADGLTIVGQGINPDGCEQAFLVRLASSACYADFNLDGFIDFFDYDAFVGCFESGQCPQSRTADVNADGFVDFFDYDAFVVAFETGAC